MKRDLCIEQQLENENSRKLDLLHSQTLEMTNAANHMHTSILASSSLLETINLALEKGKTGMGRTVAKFEETLASTNSKLSIYIAGVLIILFVVAWKFT